MMRVKNSPEPGMSRGPFELVLLVQMNGEAIASSEALATHVTFVTRRESPLYEEILQSYLTNRTKM